MQTNSPRPFAARMGRWSARNRKKAIFGWLAFVIAAAGHRLRGRHAEARRPTRGIGDSGRAEQIIDDGYPEAKADETVLVQGRGAGSVRAPEVRAAVADVDRHRRRAIADVAGVESPYAKGNDGQVAKDGRSALVSFDIRGEDDAHRGARRRRSRAAVAAVGARPPRRRSSASSAARAPTRR